MINKAYGDLKVECSKGGDKSTNFVKSSANYRNLLLGGAIRAAKMDFGSGAGFDYPASVQNGLQCK